MKRIPGFLFLLLISSVIAVSCGKGGTDDPPAPGEANLAVSTDPANNTVQAPALAPYTLKVRINSVMPPNGVKIEITAKKESDNSVFFTQAGNSSAAVNDFTITGTPATTQCLVSITVTSLTKASNTWAGSYRYSSK